MRRYKNFETIKPNNRQDIGRLYNNSIKELQRLENQLVYMYGDEVNVQSIRCLNKLLYKIEQMVSKCKFQALPYEEKKENSIN